MTGRFKLPYSFLALAAVLLVTACGSQHPTSRAAGEIFDPYEQTNRRIHAFNKTIDRNAVRPVSKSYVAIVPADAVTIVGNFSENLSMPGSAVNYLLQGDLKGTTRALGRFVINTTLGIGGIADVASELNIADARTDFGTTLHVWGAKEGAYVELPFFGPSNTRDAVGTTVDFFTNPLSYLPSKPIESIGTPTKIIDQLGDRGTYSDTIDSVLYESADSYAQARQIYLQNRRFELGDTESDPDIDPFALDTGGF